MLYSAVCYREEILPAYLPGEKQQLHNLKLGRICGETVKVRESKVNQSLWSSNTYFRVQNKSETSYVGCFFWVGGVVMPETIHLSLEDRAKENHLSLNLMRKNVLEEHLLHAQHL